MVQMFVKPRKPPSSIRHKSFLCAFHLHRTRKKKGGEGWREMKSIVCDNCSCLFISIIYLHCDFLNVVCKEKDTKLSVAFLTQVLIFMFLRKCQSLHILHSQYNNCYVNQGGMQALQRMSLSFFVVALSHCRYYIYIYINTHIFLLSAVLA